LNDEFNTSIGANFTGGSKFGGFLRELRFWYSSRKSKEIADFRMTSVLPSSPQLQHYFRFNSGNEIF